MEPKPIRSTRQEAAQRDARIDAPERWSVHAPAHDVASLDIPADLARDRSFEIDCRFVVQRRAGAADAQHAMKVYVDGSLEWSRRIDTSNPDATDSLDYRFRRHLPSGQALRVAVTTEVRGAVRVSLSMEAEES